MVDIDTNKKNIKHADRVRNQEKSYINGHKQEPGEQQISVDKHRNQAVELTCEHGVGPGIHQGHQVQAVVQALKN